MSDAPEAEPFVALGRGNGFPFCLESVDVSGFDYWSTLGGFKKGDAGSPSAAQLSLSLQNACKLYWMSYGFDTLLDGNSIEDTYTINADSNLIQGAATPKERLCVDGWRITSEIDGDQGSFGTLLLNAQIKKTSLDVSGIVRMYDGGKFVGYGVQSDFSIGDFINGLSVYLASGTSKVFIYLCSYGDSGFGPNGALEDLQYIQFEGINFLCAASAIGYTTESVDASNRTASADDNWNDFTVTLDSLKFYTIPS